MYLLHGLPSDLLRELFNHWIWLDDIAGVQKFLSEYNERLGKAPLQRIDVLIPRSGRKVTIYGAFY